MNYFGISPNLKPELIKLLMSLGGLRRNRRKRRLSYQKERRIEMNNLIETIINTLDCEYDEIAQDLYTAFEE